MMQRRECPVPSADPTNHPRTHRGQLPAQRRAGGLTAAHQAVIQPAMTRHPEVHSGLVGAVM